jgi:drug/metabolite transporter (DMT)-like permease
MTALRAVGLAALVAAVLIWAGWIVVVRATVDTTGLGLSPLDIAVVRYGVPALVLAPVWLGCGPWPRGLPLWRLAGMVLGWGAPFALLAAQGLRSADTALFAAMVPGSMPLWLWLMTIGLTRVRPAPQALAGMVLIAAGAAAAVAIAVAAGRPVGGLPFLMAASAGWAAYALAFRGAGLTAVQATAVVSFWSALGLLPVALLVPLRLWSLPLPVLAEQVVVQGLVSGIAAVVAFAFAIRALGATRAAGGAALVPVLAAVGGWRFLGDPLDAPVILALVATVAGVALVNAAPVRA